MPFEITRPLAQQQTETSERIDALAGRTRLKYITSVPGQDSTYAAKLADAKAYIAAGYPTDATPYVWVNTEATDTGVTPRALADFIVGVADRWAVVGAKIEGARLAAKQAVNAKDATITAIRAAEQTFITTMGAL